MAPVSTKRLTPEISKEKSNYAQFCCLVSDIAEEVLLCSKKKAPEGACDLIRIRQCRSKLTQLHDKYGQPSISEVDFGRYWKDISDALIGLGLAKYKEPISDLEHQPMEKKFCKVCIEILDHLMHLSESRLDETGAKTHEMSDYSKRKETEDFSKAFKRQPEVPESEDKEMHRTLIELELENQPLLLRALPYVLEDNKKSVHLYVYSGDRDTVEELKKKAKIKFSKFNALIECTDLAVTPFKTPPFNFPERVEQLDSKTIEEINNAIQNNLCDFSSHRNVTAIMAGQKVSKSYYSNKPCITVYVMGKGRIPFGETELPKNVGNFATDVVEGFVIELNSHGELYHTVSRPLKLGVSVGVKGKNEAGTLGAIVKDKKGNMFALSCEHVFNPDSFDENSQIEQPALIDYVHYIQDLADDLKEAVHQGKPEFELEYTMTKIKQMVNSRPQVIGSYKTGIKQNVSFNGYKYFVDAALVQLTKEEQSRLINEGIKLCENKYKTYSYGPEGEPMRQEVKVATPNGNYKPLANLSHCHELHKCGRTTGLTVKGEMTYDKLFVPMPPKLLDREPQNEKFNHGEINNLWCYNCMVIKSGGKKVFSDKGDSGSLVLDEEGNAWALIFAYLRTCFDTWKSIACPIEVVLKELGSKIDSELTIIGNATL